MTRRVTACAHANIALVKYWGKRPGAKNVPATPSISLTLEALTTETTLQRLPRGPEIVRLNGCRADKEFAGRVVGFLRMWRRKRLVRGMFSVTTVNRFPTRAGLASSASGFAALTMALSALSSTNIAITNLTRLARLGSGSAARSMHGGLAALPASLNPAARLLLPAKSVPWGMVICEVEAGPKQVGSSEGMNLSRSSSPYYRSWVSHAARDYREMLSAIRRLDLEAVGEIAEANALAMHSCMIATRPALIYWSPATVELLHEVKSWRKKGWQVYATIDAGPHVALLARRRNLRMIAGKAKKLPGVKSVLTSLPGEGARLVALS